MIKAQEGQSFWIFDFICALVCLVFFVVQVNTLMFGGSVLALITAAGLGFGAFLHYYNRLSGIFFVPAGVALALINLPLMIPAFVVMGGYIYLWAVIGIASAAVAKIFWSLWRGIILGIFVFFTLFLTTGSMFESGTIGAGCPSTPEILISSGGTLSNDPDPQQLACGIEAGSVIVSYPKQGKVSLLDIQRGLRHEADFAPGELTALGSGQTMVLAVSGDRGKVTALNARDLSVLHDFTLGEDGCGIRNAVLSDLYLRSMFLCRGKQSLIFADTLRGNLSEVVHRVGMMPYRIGVNNALERAYVTDLIGNQVSEFDIETMSLLRRIPVGVGSSDIAVSTIDHKVYVAMPLKEKIRIYDGVTLKMMKNIPGPSGVTRLAIDPINKRLFAVSFKSGELMAINLYTPSSPDTYELGAQVRDMIYCKAGGYLYYSTPCGVHYLKSEQLFN